MHPVPPHIRNHNRCVLDLNKVTHASTWWVSYCGSFRRKLKPKQPTVHGKEFNVDEFAQADMRFPLETMLERATRLGILDVWVPISKFQLSNNHSLIYVGDKAQSTFKEYSRRIFKKGK